MTRALDLTSARLKLNRANVYIERFIKDIRDTDQDGQTIWLAQDFDPKDSSIVVFVEKVKDIPNDWNLIFGDAAFNLRCALDHIAWQLALRKFDCNDLSNADLSGRIYFPIAMSEEAWESGAHREYILEADAAKLKKFQPFSDYPETEHWLIAPIAMLFQRAKGLHNLDKHRAIQLQYMVASGVYLFGDKLGEKSIVKAFGCEPLFDNDGRFIVKWPTRVGALKPGDEIARILVRKTEAEPHLEFDARLVCYVGIGEIDAPAADMLSIVAGQITAILGEFS